MVADVSTAGAVRGTINTIAKLDTALCGAGEPTSGTRARRPRAYIAFRSIRVRTRTVYGYGRTRGSTLAECGNTISEVGADQAGINSRSVGRA